MIKFTNNKDKILNFKARSKIEFHTQLKPYPSSKALPKWFLNSTPYINSPDQLTNDGKVHVRNRESNANFKKCMPLLDGMNAGYIIPLWADVEVDSVNQDKPFIFWKTISDVFQEHGFNTRNIESPLGYNNQVFKYLNCWIPQTPKGYSCLITSPLGYNDSVFKAIPAVVDTDKSTLELIFPVWVRDNFQGIVEKGTPMVQVIPFKRDNWQATFDYYENGEYKNVIEEKNFNSTIVNHYIKNHWSKKTFR